MLIWSTIYNCFLLYIIYSMYFVYSFHIYFVSSGYMNSKKTKIGMQNKYEINNQNT